MKGDSRCPYCYGAGQYWTGGQGGDWHVCTHRVAQWMQAHGVVATSKPCWSCTVAKGDELSAFHNAERALLGKVTVFEIQPDAEGPDTIRLHFHRVT